MKLPLRKGREGKVLGRIDAGDEGDDVDQGEGKGDGLVFRAANAAESHGFRALFSAEDDEALAAAAPFAGQVIINTSSVLLC